MLSLMSSNYRLIDNESASAISAGVGRSKLASGFTDRASERLTPDQQTVESM